MFSIICYFSIISVVFAFNMSIYSGFNYYTSNNRIPSKNVKDKYNFSYQLNDQLFMDVHLKNAAPGVTAKIYITQTLTSSEGRGDTRNETMTNCNSSLCLYLHRIILNTPSIYIGLQLFQASTPCSTIVFTEGKQTLSNTTSKDMCVSSLKNTTNLCVIEMDLQNECKVENKVTHKPSQSINEGNQKENIEEGTKEASSSSPPPPSSWSQNNKSGFNVTYIILSVIGIICVLILAICLFVKKYYHRKKTTEQIEMNSYAPSNEIIYADLGFEHDNSRPPDGHLPRKAEEECPYAEIIGVLQPKK